MLAAWAMLYVGAVGVATTNIAVKLRVANGTKVAIMEVVPHPNDIHGWDQMQKQQKQVVRLSQPPTCVFVKLTEANEWSREFRQGEPSISKPEHCAAERLSYFPEWIAVPGWWRKWLIDSK
jgi:hypothetical protein